jgi:hypothetical protein
MSVKSEKGKKDAAYYDDQGNDGVSDIAETDKLAYKFEIH